MSSPVTPEECAQAGDTLRQASEGELLVSTACPGCGTRFALLVRSGLAVKPPGTFSLAGAQTKFAARSTHLLRCVACSWTGEGQPK